MHALCRDLRIVRPSRGRGAMGQCYRFFHFRPPWFCMCSNRPRHVEKEVPHPVRSFHRSINRWKTKPKLVEVHERSKTDHARRYRARWVSTIRADAPGSGGLCCGPERAGQRLGSWSPFGSTFWRSKRWNKVNITSKAVMTTGDRGGSIVPDTVQEHLRVKSPDRAKHPLTQVMLWAGSYAVAKGSAMGEGP